MASLHPLITAKELDWLAQYIHNASPSGNERAGQQLWLDYILPFADEHFTDSYGNAVAIINPGKDFKVVVEAHADEIAWAVKRIGPDGYIHVQEAGIADAGIAPSQRVNIHTAKGTVRGIFGWPAIHTRDEGDEKAPKNSNIFIHCGCKSSEEVRALGIRVGDFITYDAGFEVLNNDYFTGRALDNRIGGFMLARLARLLKEESIELPYTLYLVNAVQEEVGMKGAKMIAHTIQPDCAIVIDVTHDTASPMMDKDKEGDLCIGNGPVITKAAPIHTKLRSLLEATADEQKIGLQYAVEADETGTDADAFAYENGGIPTALLSLALCFMHTTVETIHRDDVEAGIRLLFHALHKLSADFDFKYL